MSLEQVMLSLWYPEKNQNFGYKLLSKIAYVFLKPLEVLYRSIIFIRTYLYHINFLPSYRAKLPIIIIGNLTVGGSGKTPLVIAVVKLLKKHGFKPAVILRGYGADHLEKLTLVDENTSISECGDEAKLIYNNTLSPVVTCKHRKYAVKYLEDNDLCDIIISDDGLQHYKLARDIEICVIDPQRKYGNQSLLPLGPLREPLSRLKNVDFVLTKSVKVTAVINLKSHQDVGINFANGINQTIHAVSAIGNNNSFTDSLAALGFKNFKARHYPDHFIYTAEEINQISNHNILLTTEKDAVKIKELEPEIAHYHNIYFLKVESLLSDEFSDQFIKKIRQLSVNQAKNIHSTNKKTVVEEIC